MNMASIDETIEALEKIRLGVCCYHSTSFCDCKYGVAQAKSRQPWEDGGEVTGCPELRSAMIYLKELKKWKRVQDLLETPEESKGDLTHQLDMAIGLCIKLRMINARYATKLDKAGISKEWTAEELAEVDKEMESDERH